MYAFGFLTTKYSNAHSKLKSCLEFWSMANKPYVGEDGKIWILKFMFFLLKTISQKKNIRPLKKNEMITKW